MARKTKNRAAVVLSRLGASKGGFARAARLTAEERSASARRAVLARWARSRAKPGAVGESRASYTGEKETAAARDRAERAARVLGSWLEDESGYDERAWPKLKRGLERARLSSRRLFGG